MLYAPKDIAAERAARAAHALSMKCNPARPVAERRKVRPARNFLRTRPSFFYFRHPRHPMADPCGQWRASAGSARPVRPGRVSGRSSADPRRG